MWLVLGSITAFVKAMSSFFGISFLLFFSLQSANKQWPMQASSDRDLLLTKSVCCFLIWSVSCVDRSKLRLLFNNRPSYYYFSFVLRWIGMYLACSLSRLRFQRTFPSEWSKNKRFSFTLSSTGCRKTLIRIDRPYTERCFSCLEATY